MDQVPILVLQMLRWFTVLSMAGSVVLGLAMAGLTLFRWRSKLLANVLFGLLLGTLSLTVFHNLLGYLQLTAHSKRWHFLPIYFSLSLGPLLYFSTKARLFPSTRLRLTDYKHFILPTVQCITFCWIGFRNAAYKSSLDSNFSAFLYGPLEDSIFIVSSFLYLSFSYRFVRYAWQLQQQQQHRRWALVIRWQRRMLKIFGILLGLHASYLVSHYLAWRIFGINLLDKALFSSFGELGLAALLTWLSLNAWFAHSRSI